MDTLTVMPVAPLDPISAVTAPDPYEFYSELVAERPLYFDDRLHLWVASSARSGRGRSRQPALPRASGV